MSTLSRLRARHVELGAVLAVAVLLISGCSEGSNELAPTSSGEGGSPLGSSTVGGGGSAGTAVGGAGGAGGDGQGGIGGVPPIGANCDPASGPPATLQLTPVHTDLDFPVMVTHARGDERRLYIVEVYLGHVLVSVDGAPPTLFLDVGESGIGFSSGGERGLLGIAFHPNYVNNGRFWVHYTSNVSNLRNEVQEFRRDPDDPDRADPVAVHSPALRVPQPFGNHNGGHIAFGPHDDLLYVAIGDGGMSGDPDDDAPDVTKNYLGKLLRIDVSAGDGTFSVPAGNAPGTISGFTDAIYDWGLRNPYRFSFDPCSGDRYIGDVGGAIREEIDVAPAGQGPTNWGWNCFEGSQLHDGADGCPFGGETPPVHEYDHTGDSHAITGGVVYRGSAIPSLRGSYFYADFVSGRIWSFRYEGGAAVGNNEVFNIGNVGGFGDDAAGEVYVCERGGTVYRIDAL